jgi:adenine-specific DNA-methyltransferase
MTRPALLSDHVTSPLNADLVLERVELGRVEASNRIAVDAERRSELGQFFTPSAIARFMAGLITDRNRGVTRLLDAGGGNGMLTAATVAELLGRQSIPSRIEVSLWEIDASLAGDIESTLSLCRSLCAGSGVEFSARVFHTDFIRDAADRIVGERLFRGDTGHFDLAILNPPYRKRAICIPPSCGSPSRCLKRGVSWSRSHPGAI